MSTTKLSSKGQVIIPKPIRTAHSWDAGQELLVINFEDGILLKPKKPFADTNIEDIVGCLKYTSKTKSIKEMDSAIAKGIKEKYK